MKVVFSLYWDTADSYGAELASCARIMVDSCKRFGHEVWQLSDMDSKKIDGVDKVVRKKYEPHALFRFRHLAEVDPPYLSMDVDAFMAKDASGIADSEFDAVLTSRRSFDGMPYNAGVFWVNNNQFIDDCLDSVRKMPFEKQRWFADQHALAEIAPKYRVKELPCEDWNFSPDSDSDYRDNVVIYHFKGKRKELMKPFYRRSR